MAKYDPLRDHLKNSATGTVTLSFARIDELVGGLPRSARTHRAWWSNHEGRHVQAQAWLAAGRTVTSVDLVREQVAFQRMA
ncbi:unannotated protein [freshwater metagenome]|uniref:Unannotated protein n=1 Tax=freshwater metagenome TaxID=449393 RepID=A0A6J6VWQ2_9ZZZZ